MHDWNINIPQHPNQTMYQNAQLHGNYHDCGIYCVISLNYLFEQLTQRTEMNENKNKNKNKNRKQIVKLREIEEIPMEEGFSVVRILRDLLTNDIKVQYEALTQQINNNDKIEANQYISYREKSDKTLLPKDALSWKYFGKVVSIDENKTSDQIRIVGINKVDNENPTEFTYKTIDFINRYEWMIMNSQEINAFKKKYLNKIERAFCRESNNNNDDSNKDNNDDENNTDSNDKKHHKRGRGKRNISAILASQPKPTKKRRIDNDNKSKSSNPKQNATKRKRTETLKTNANDSETDSETQLAPPTKRRKLTEESLQNKTNKQ